MSASLLLASNRGPVSFRPDDAGSPTAHRGGGGLVSALAGVAAEADSLWVCAAMTEADRDAAHRSPKRLDVATQTPVRMLDVGPDVFDRAYNRVANSTLWFLAHMLFATPTAPVFDADFRRDWQAYRDYGEAFAAALAEEAAPGARVLVQDYHLALTPRQLRERRPDVRIGHFTHTPWAPPEYFGLLPCDVGREVLTGMLGADAVGFLSARWAEAFVRCCEQLLGARRGDGVVHHEGGSTRVDVHPLGVDADELRRRAGEPDVQDRRRTLREELRGRRLVLRIDRTEPSKNIVRGLLAFRELLRAEPQWRGQVVHLALAYPSRYDLPAYREYTAAAQRVAHEVNEELATDDWQPVQLEVRDDYPRSLASYALADVLLVNPLRDGMNLVAKEGPVLSERGVALVLSSEAGAADELGEAALLVNPYDVEQTAQALHVALSTPAADRAARSARLAQAASALPPAAWLSAQRDALT